MDHNPMPSANGRAFQAYLETALAVLQGVNVVDYYQLALPDPLDETLFGIVSAYSALPGPQRERFVAALSPQQRSLLGVFGHRAATLSVREQDPERLRIGLVANAIANTVIPEKRNVDVALAVFHHCAQRLALDPVALFDEAAELATDEAAARMRAFGRRSDVTLQQYGWREMRTAEGVRFKFEWR
jgi:hypothetical protein